MQRDERRVDPAREAEHDVLEAVLVDVVAHAEHERGVDLGVGVEQLGDRPAGRAPRRDPALGARTSRGRRTAGATSPRRAAARRVSRSRAAPAAASRSTSQTSSSSSNCGARAMISPSWSTTNEWPSKTSSSWPPTRLQKTTAARLSRARWASICSRSTALAGVVGRGRDVERSPARRPAPRRSPAAPAPRCPRRSSARPCTPSTSMTAAARARAGSSAARRRRRSWAGGPCGRSPRRAPSASTAAAL